MLQSGAKVTEALKAHRDTHLNSSESYRAKIGFPLITIGPWCCIPRASLFEVPAKADTSNYTIISGEQVLLHGAAFSNKKKKRAK